MWTAEEMLEIDPHTEGHKLEVNKQTLIVAQKREKKSPEKVEAISKAMTHHLTVKFKTVANYITSLLKVVLVKKNPTISGVYGSTIQISTKHVPKMHTLFPI